MIDRNFISQPAPLKKMNSEELPSAMSGLEADMSSARVIMTEFDVFHDSGTPYEQSKKDEELESARLYQEGVEAGKAEAAAVYEQTVKVMEMTLDQLKTRLESQIKEIEDSHARILVRSLEAVLPETAKQVLLSEILNRVLQSEIQGVLTAYIHPDNETANAFLQSKTNHPIKVIEDPNMTLGKVRFDWETSQVEIDPGQAVETCLALLKSTLGQEINPADPQFQNKGEISLTPLQSPILNSDPTEEAAS
jgi:hypothetical protein